MSNLPPNYIGTKLVEGLTQNYPPGTRLPGGIPNYPGFGAPGGTPGAPGGTPGAGPNYPGVIAPGTPPYKHPQTTKPIPHEDGDINWYRVQLPTPNGSPIMFVNGIMTAPRDHADAAEVLCYITRGPVKGLYNETGSLYAGLSIEEMLTAIYNSEWLSQLPGPDRIVVEGCLLAYMEYLKLYPGTNASTDLIQCTMDFVRIMVASWSAGIWKPVAGLAPQLFYELIKIFLTPNMAARSLFMDLYNSTTRYPIVAHSQGNLVTSSALWMLSLFDTIQTPKLAGIQVFAVASPAPKWPAGVLVRTYMHTDDPVAWFGIFPNRSGWKENFHGGLGFCPNSHLFMNYLKDSQLVKDIRTTVGIPPGTPAVP